jgi:hypothetical protein
MAHFIAATDRLRLLAVGCGISLGCAGNAAGTGADGHADEDSPATDGSLEGASPCRGRLGEQPGSSVATTHRVLWRLPTPQTALVQGIADDTTLYLRDNRASIWRVGEDQTEATLLHSLEGAMSELSGAMVADGEYLYWGEAAQQEGERAAPSRVMRMLETGGPVSVLAESEEHVLGAFGVDGDQLVVSVESNSFQRLALVDKQGGELSPLTQSLPFYQGRQVGAAVYWTDGPDVGSAPNDLLRAELPAFEPQVVVIGVRGPVFDVGPGYVLTREGSVEDERLALLGQSFVLFDHASGCSQVLPGNGNTISYRTAQDETHVYWLRHVNGYSFSPDNPPPPPETPLYRTDIRSGLTERIETPGFSPTFGSWIIASDSRHVYLDTPLGVVVIDKP